MDVLKLLNSKSRCLQKLLSLSQDLLIEVQNENFSTLDRFHGRSTSTLKALNLYDRKIAESLKSFLSEPHESEEISDLNSRIKTISSSHETLIKQILSSDQEIISKIEQEKLSLSKTLMASDKTNQFVKKFKSRWISESGEKLDDKI